MLAMSVIDPTGAVTREVMSFSPRIVISPRWPEGVTYPAPPTRPSPVASLLNEFDFEMSGIIEDASPAVPREVRAEPTHFTVRSRVVLQTGWRAIEVYPLIAERHWIPEAAPQWAETDLLFALFQRNTRDQELRRQQHGRGTFPRATDPGDQRRSQSGGSGIAVR